MLKIKLIGVGGIGTNLLLFLPRYLAYQQKEEVELTLIDGDAFEGRNRERQAFSGLGNKAQAKAMELRAEFPEITVLTEPVFVTQGNIRQLIRGGDIVLLSVDNHRTRLLVSRRCRQLANAVLISAGNGLADGNCQVYIRSNRKDLTVPLERYHPEIRFPQDKNPGEDPSCLVQAAEGEPQLVITNMAAAVSMAEGLYQVLEGIVPAGEVYFNIRDGEHRARERRIHVATSGD